MAIYIPALGDAYPGNPPVDKSVRLTFGYSSDNDIQITSTGTYTLASVLQNVMIKNIRGRINTVFTTNMTMIVGDSDDTDGWFTDTDLAPESSDVAGIWNIGSGAYADGRSYSAVQDIQAVIAGTACLAGAGELIITYCDLPQ